MGILRSALSSIVIPGMAIGGFVGLLEAVGLRLYSPTQFWDANLLLLAPLAYAAAAILALGVLRLLLIPFRLGQLLASAHGTLAALLVLTLVLEVGVTGAARGWQHEPSSVLNTANPVQAWAICLSVGAVILFLIWFFFLRAISKIPTLRWLFSTKTMLVVVLAVAGVATIVRFSSTSQRAPNTKGLPNILLIVMDTARVDGLSCYGMNGVPPDNTPNLDRLAKEGSLFTRAIAQAPWTLPSHSSLFTGLYATQHGVCKGGDRLFDSYTTMAEFLQSVGYQTVGLSNNPAFVNQQTGLAQGFKEWFPMWKISAEEVSAYNRRLRTYPTLRLDLFWRTLAKTLPLPEKENAIFDEGARVTTRLARRWLAYNGLASRPFFMFINYMEPHEPYGPPRQIIANHIAAKPDLTSHLKTEEERELWQVLISGFDTDTAPKNSNMLKRYATLRYLLEEYDVSIEFKEAVRDLYLAQMKYLDTEMGRLFDYLRQNGLIDNTVVIVTSDHGEHLGEHRLWLHEQYLHNELVHVPLIIRYPKHFPAAQRSDPVQLIDLFPTMEALTGRSLNTGREHRRGVSLLEPGPLDRPAFTQRGFITEPSLLGWVKSMKAYLTRSHREKAEQPELNKAAVVAPREAEVPPSDKEAPPEVPLDDPIKNKTDWLKSHYNSFSTEEGQLIGPLHALSFDIDDPLHQPQVQESMKKLEEVLQRGKNRWSIHLAVIQGPWKYHWNSCDNPALYDIDKDYNETGNRLGKEDAPLETKMHGLLQSWLGTLEPADVSIPPGLTDEDLHEARKMGYIGGEKKKRR